MIPKLLLYAGIVINLGLGTLSLLDPASVLGPVGLTPTGPLSEVELRAWYGGYALGMVGFLAWCAREEDRLPVALLVQGCTIGGVAVSRSAMTLVFGPDGPLMTVVSIIELLFAAGCLWGWRAALDSDA